MVDYLGWIFEASASTTDVLLLISRLEWMYALSDNASREAN